MANNNLKTLMYLFKYCLFKDNICILRRLIGELYFAYFYTILLFYVSHNETIFYEIILYQILYPGKLLDFNSDIYRLTSNQYFKNKITLYYY